MNKQFAHPMEVLTQNQDSIFFIVFFFLFPQSCYQKQGYALTAPVLLKLLHKR